LNDASEEILHNRKEEARDHLDRKIDGPLSEANLILKVHQ